MFRPRAFVVQCVVWLAALAIAAEPLWARPCNCQRVAPGSKANAPSPPKQPAHRCACCRHREMSSEPSAVGRCCCCCAAKCPKGRVDYNSVCPCTVQKVPLEPAPVPVSPSASQGAVKFLQPLGAIALPAEHGDPEVFLPAWAPQALVLSAAEHCIALCRLRF
jgi:hypothetical protein